MADTPTIKKTTKKTAAKKKKTKGKKSLSLEQKLRELSKITLDIAACENKKRELEARANVLRMELGAVLTPLMGGLMQTATAPVAPAPTHAPAIPISGSIPLKNAPAQKPALAPFLQPRKTTTAPLDEGAVDPTVVVSSLTSGNKKGGFVVDKFHNEDGSPKSIFTV